MFGLLENILPLPRPFLKQFARKLSPRDKRRIQKFKGIKKYQMVKKTIGKNGRVQVLLGFSLFGFDPPASFEPENHDIQWLQT